MVPRPRKAQSPRPVASLRRLPAPRHHRCPRHLLRLRAYGRPGLCYVSYSPLGQLVPAKCGENRHCRTIVHSVMHSRWNVGSCRLSVGQLDIGHWLLTINTCMLLILRQSHDNTRDTRQRQRLLSLQGHMGYWEMVGMPGDKLQ